MKALAKSFETFQLRGLLRRPEDLQSGGAKRIDDACGKRRLRPDHREASASFLANSTSSGMAVSGTLNNPSSRAVPRVAGRHVDASDARDLRQPPGKRVLAAAAADDE